MVILPLAEEDTPAVAADMEVWAVQQSLEGAEVAVAVLEVILVTAELGMVELVTVLVIVVMVAVEVVVDIILVTVLVQVEAVV
jgi:hypothetical protein